MRLFGILNYMLHACMVESEDPTNFPSDNYLCNYVCGLLETNTLISHNLIDYAAFSVVYLIFAPYTA